MQLLILAGVLALAASQKTTTIDPSVLINIFGTPPTTVTRKPLEEVDSTLDPVLLEALFGQVGSTLDPVSLEALFGKPKTPRVGPSIPDVPRSKTDGNVAGQPTLKPSLLTEIFGTPPTKEQVNPTRDTQGTSNVKTEGASTLDPSVLKDIFGTPPTPQSPNQTHENVRIEGVPQGSNQGVPTIKPSLLTEIFGTPPTANSSRQGYDVGDRTAKKPDGGSRNVDVEGIPTIDPDLLAGVFGTPPTTTEKSSRSSLEDVSLRNNQFGSDHVSFEGSSNEFGRNDTLEHEKEGSYRNHNV